MKTKFRFIMVLCIMTIAIVTAGVPLGKNAQGTIRTSEELTGCYTEQDVSLLMEEGHYPREQAIVLLNLACENAITPNNIEND